MMVAAILAAGNWHFLFVEAIEVFFSANTKSKASRTMCLCLSDFHAAGDDGGKTCSELLLEAVAQVRG